MDFAVSSFAFLSWSQYISCTLFISLYLFLELSFVSVFHLLLDNVNLTSYLALCGNWIVFQMKQLLLVFGFDSFDSNSLY